MYSHADSRKSEVFFAYKCESKASNKKFCFQSFAEESLNWKKFQTDGHRPKSIKAYVIVHGLRVFKNYCKRYPQIIA